MPDDQERPISPTHPDYYRYRELQARATLWKALAELVTVATGGLRRAIAEHEREPGQP